MLGNNFKFPNIKFKNIFIILSLIDISISQEIIFENDTLCEQFGSSLMSHILHYGNDENIPLKKNINDKFKNITFYDIIRNSGTGFNDLGNYSGCKRNKEANYYLMSIGSSNNPFIRLNLGICYYKECSNKYFQNFTNKLINKVEENLYINIRQHFVINFINPDEEYENLKSIYGKGMRISLIILIMLSFFELIIALIKPRNKFLKAFNFSNNIKSLLTVKSKNKLFEYLRIFDGIRLFSSFYITLGHVCVFTIILGAKNVTELFILSKKWYFAIITSTYYAVDLFFYMSGFFFVFSIQKYLNRKINKFKLIIISIILRIIRFLPFMIIAIFGFTYLLPFLSNGPKYSLVIILTKGCLKNYWDNLLFINNLINYSPIIEEGTCFNHGWYLSCDMQFFIYSILIVIIFNDKPKVRAFIFILTFISCPIIQIYIVYKKGYAYNDIFHINFHDIDKTLEQFQNYYSKPYVRITPYLIGVFFGKLFLETRLYKKYNKEKKEEEKVIIEKDTFDINQLNDKNLQSKEFEFPLLSSSSQIMQNSFFPTEISNKNDINNNLLNVSFQKMNESKDIFPGNNNEIKNEEENEEIDNIYYKINKYLEKNDFICYIIEVFSIILYNLLFWSSSISNKLDKGLSLFWSAMFQTFGKVIYIFCLGILIHLIFLGKLNIIRKLLSLKIENQIIKSSYGIYVVHFYFIIMFFFSYNNCYYLRIWDIILLTVGIFLFSWVFSFIIGIIFESPFIVLCKNSKKNLLKF